MVVAAYTVYGLFRLNQRVTVSVRLCETVCMYFNYTCSVL